MLRSGAHQREGAESVAEKVYRAAIIGCGRIASSIEDEVTDAPYWALLPYSHAGAYERCARTELIAGADTDGERLRAFGERRGVRALYADYREMLAQERPDVVSVCTPTRSHPAVAIDVARAGVRGIYLEKPIAQSLAEADEMIAAFEASGVAVAVNHIRTWDAYYSRIRQMIASGVIGQLHSIMAHWREGVLFGGTHLFDLVRSLVGAEAEWVFGRIDGGTEQFDPGAAGMVMFTNGVALHVNATVGNSVAAELDIVGSQGRIRVGNTLYPEVWVAQRQGRRTVLAQGGFPGMHDGRSGMVRAVEDLVRAIEGGPPPASDAQDARRDLELAVALHLSHGTGGVVRLPVTDVAYVIHDPWGRG